ncbi:hypothetical protein [Virgisporangium aliadipatigenens]|nr:hypothetical protein [Virgisporangium aliadipatigenens]
MAVLETALTTAGGALSAGVGVVLGALLTRRAQDRHWVRDRQLAAYQDLLREYATFVIIIKRAHDGRTGWNYDWARWSAALTCASLVAPVRVAREIDAFGRAVGGFLGVAARDTIGDPLDAAAFDRAMRGPAEAQIALVNAIRDSLEPGSGTLDFPLGGSVSDRRPD